MGKINKMLGGEALCGDGNEIAHIDLIMGPRGSAAETVHTFDCSILVVSFNPLKPEVNTMNHYLRSLFPAIALIALTLPWGVQAKPAAKVKACVGEYAL